MLTTTVNAIMTHVSPEGPPLEKCCNKISVIGVDSVGTAIAFALLAKNITSDLVLIDKDEDLTRGEMLDIEHATMYLNSPNISSSTDYESSANSKILILTAGAKIEPGVEKEEIVKKSTEMFREIIPELVSHSPDCILLVVTHPVDIMSYVAWKLSGLPPHRVIGSGTTLESARFRYLLSQKLDVSARNCQAFVIGEQGENSVPIWSGVSVSGVRLREVNHSLGTENDPEDWEELHKQVVDSAKEVIKLKGCGSWGMALSICRIVKAILEDTRECFPVSTHIRGCRHGVDKDVFMSLPCILGANGVAYTVRQMLSKKEKDMLQQSADSMYAIQCKLSLSSPPPKSNAEEGAPSECNAQDGTPECKAEDTPPEGDAEEDAAPKDDGEGAAPLEEGNAEEAAPPEGSAEEEEEM